jgi:signal transduction histidine kinase
LDRDKISRLLVIVPIVSFVFAAIVMFVFIVYNQMQYFEKEKINVENRALAKVKQEISTRVDNVIKYIEHEKNKAQKSDVRDYIKFLKDGSKYVFVYELLNINGGKNFAKMAVNPNRPDLVGKYLSDDYKDANGKEFRKEFLEKIKLKCNTYSSIFWSKLNRIRN